MSLEWLAERLGQIEGIVTERSVSSASLCTYRVGGPLALLATVDDPAALDEFVEAVAHANVATLPIGKGSNLLVADAGFDGVAIKFGDAFNHLEINGNLVTARAGIALPVAARATVAASLTGFEWAVGVPGSMGGAVRMNAGGHGSDMAASLVDVTVADLHEGVVTMWPVEHLDLGYRHSNLGLHQLVTQVTLELQYADVGHGGASELKEIVSWRRANQPGGANAGSVFTNPPGDSAGRLIDAAGLKGMRIGTAVISEKHANFIQADPDGRADDVILLMAEVVDRVRDAFGVELHGETRLIGFEKELVDHVQASTTSEGDLPHG